jgi:ubiquinone/menaquinone biosynthesis C-methylase UbiE
MKSEIIEDKLNIGGDYQYNAIRSKNFLQANWHRNKLMAIKKLVNLNSKMTVLDIGTGSGNFEVETSKLVKRIVGVDYNGKALAFLRQKLRLNRIRNVKLVQCRAEKLGKLKLGKFDLVLMIDVIEHIDQQNIGSMANAIYDLTKIGGMVCIVTPNYGGLWPIIEWLTDKLSLLPKMAEEQHLSKFDVKKLNCLFETKNMQSLYLCSFNLFSYLSPLRIINAWLCRLELQLNNSYGNLLVGVWKKTK